MKQYKVGDTIYIKDTVNNIDEHDPIGTYRGKYTGWFANRTIIDELPVAEPVKPVLPKDVADELKHAKDNSLNFYGYLKRAVDYGDRVTWQFIFNAGDTDARIALMLDAWLNGYTVKQPKPQLYNLVLGYDTDDTDGDTCNALNKQGGGLFIDTCSLLDDDLKADPDYQFTQEEIDKYNKNFWIKNIDLNDYKIEVD